MTVRPDVIPAALIALGVLACGAAVATLRPQPLPPAAGGAWASIDNAWGAPIPGQTYSLDAVLAGTERRDPAAVIRLRRGSTIGVRGWAFDPGALRTADRFSYRVDGGPWRDATYHLARNDVAQSYRLGAVWDCGFEVNVPAGALAPGAHTLELATAVGASETPLPITLRLSVVR